MTGHDTSLIRKYAQLTALIEHTKVTIAAMKSREESSIGIRIFEIVGSVFAARMDETRKEMRKAGITARYEDNGGESIVVHSNVRGDRRTHEINRWTLEEEVARLVEETADDLSTRKYSYPSYKVVIPDRDPYEKK